MRRLALIAAAGIALAGCGTAVNHGPPVASPRPHYPSTIHFPHVTATERVSVRNGAQFVSRTRLAIVTRGSSSCPSVPDELVVLGPHTIRIHLTVGSWTSGEIVAHPPQSGVCTADYGSTPMLLAIDPKLIDVHRPLTIRVIAKHSKPGVWTVAPLRGG